MPLRVLEDDLIYTSRERMIFSVHRVGTVRVMYLCTCGLAARVTFEVEDKGTRIEEGDVERWQVMRTWRRQGKKVCALPLGNRSSVPPFVCECGEPVAGHRVKGTLTAQACTQACREATTSDCRCVCGGDKHGELHEVDDAPIL